MYNQNQLENLLKKTDLYTNDTFEKLILYIENLKKWNASINLTSKKLDIIKHIQDSLLFFEIIQNPIGELLDIGSGNGFPSIIIGILCAGLRITMVETNAKKCAFLRDTCMKLSIKARILNIDILSMKTQDTFSIATLRGLKIDSKIESKIYKLLSKEYGKLLIWTNPPPSLKKFNFTNSISKDNKYLHMYTKAQVAQQPI
ncbi:MAG: 16S rRNA (guanine(527)-N(7))-methyltransferase RsmG [Desulfurella sp.]|uniref:16S rRNA (guanine(527)-N(7))-methyltransferase RsmG n=1 Tax=Desulfurella sp. TaxID=1962857 RepID=UPI003C996491